MPLYFVNTSSEAIGGQSKTRFSGVIYAGQHQPGDGPLPHPGAMALIQTTAALSTASNFQQFVSTGDPGAGSFHYLACTTASFTSSTASAAAPAYLGIGAAVAWNDTDKRIEVWSPLSSAWFAIGSSGTSS